MARDFVKSGARAMQDLLQSSFLAVGGTSDFSPVIAVSGFGAAQLASPGMKIQLTPGSLYFYGPMDIAAGSGIYGELNGGVDLAEGQANTYQQAYDPGGNTATFVAPGSGFYWALLEASYTQVDAVRSGDTGAGLLPFFNSANPSVPLAGQTGAGGTLNTVRQGKVTFTIKYGATAGSAGAAVPPTPDANNVALYLILLASSTSNITNSMIARADTGQTSGGTPVPSIGYGSAFIRGLNTQHHLGLGGSAPKIDGSAEWLPSAAVPNNQQKFTGCPNIAKVVASVSVTPGVVGLQAGYNNVNVASVAFNGTTKVRLTLTTPLGQLGNQVFCTHDINNSPPANVWNWMGFSVTASTTGDSIDVEALSSAFAVQTVNAGFTGSFHLVAYGVGTA